MDLQQLRCFLAVAEELHFGRAAMRLHLTPSPVSRMVKSLERELGGELFARRYHEVELTPLGHTLLAHVRTIVSEADRLPGLAAEQLSKTRVVRAAASYFIAPALTERFIELVEDAVAPSSVDLKLGVSSLLVPDIVDGALDLAMVSLPVAGRDLESMPVTRRRLLIAMRADDPLASRESLTTRDLAERVLTVSPSSPQPLLVDGLRQRLTEAGITRFHRMPTVDNVQLAAHIRRTSGLTTVTQPEDGGFASVFLGPMFKVVPLRDESLYLEVGIVWNRKRLAETELIRYAVERLRERRGELTLPSDLPCPTT